MTASKCPNCGGVEFYRRVNAIANGWVVRLLPKLMPGRFEIVMCKDCGLTRFFASHEDRRDASSKWERVSSDAPDRPLGL